MGEVRSAEDLLQKVVTWTYRERQDALKKVRETMGSRWAQRLPDGALDALLELATWQILHDTLSRRLAQETKAKPAETAPHVRRAAARAKRKASVRGGGH